MGKNIRRVISLESQRIIRIHGGRNQIDVETGNGELPAELRKKQAGSY